MHLQVDSRPNAARPASSNNEPLRLNSAAPSVRRTPPPLPALPTPRPLHPFSMQDRIARGTESTELRSPPPLPKLQSKAGDPKKKKATDCIAVAGPIASADLIDPHTKQLFKDPVIAPNGFTYSKHWIEQQLIQNGYQLPNSGGICPLNQLLVDRVMQSRLDPQIEGMDYLNCPITLERFTDPVVATDGNSYDFAALKSSFALRRESPCTREPIEATVYRNRTLAAHLKALGKLEQAPGANKPALDTLITAPPPPTTQILRVYSSASSDVWSESWFSDLDSEFEFRNRINDDYGTAAVVGSIGGLLLGLSAGVLLGAPLLGVFIGGLTCLTGMEVGRFIASICSERP